jgi:hypothetical protein
MQPMYYIGLDVYKRKISHCDWPTLSRRPRCDQRLRRHDRRNRIQSLGISGDSYRQMRW